MNGVRWEQLEVAEALARLPLHQWQDPTADRPYWSRPEFRRAAVVSAPQGASMLVGVRGGVAVLAAPLITSDTAGGLLFYDVPAMIGDDRAFGTGEEQTPELTAARAAAYPSVAVASHGAYHGILVAPGLDVVERRDMCAELPDALGTLAEGSGCRSHAILYATPTLATWLHPAPTADRRLAALGAESVLESEGDSWQDFLAGVSTRRRGRMGRERRMFLAGSIETEITEGRDALGEDLIELRAGLRERYGLPGQREQSRAEFAGLARECGEALVVVRARLEGAVVGFVIFLRAGSQMYARTGGFDYERLGARDFVYFNVAYYAVLEWALPLGVRRIEYGLASYPAKRTRGCRFLPRLGLFGLPTGGVLDAALHRQDTAERRRLIDECGTSLAAAPDHGDDKETNAWT